MPQNNLADQHGIEGPPTNYWQRRADHQK